MAAELREEINQVGEALANRQVDAAIRLQEIAEKHQPLYELFEEAYDALALRLRSALTPSAVEGLDEQYHTQERNKLVVSPSNI